MGLDRYQTELVSRRFIDLNGLIAGQHELC
jgi:hypothetical protein